MVWTHVWLCGRWTWRWLTFKQWASMPHIGKQLALVKAAKVSGAIVCAGGVGLAVPPLLNATPIPVGGYERVAPAPIPEPGSVLLVVVGIAGISLVRRSRSGRGLR